MNKKVVDFIEQLHPGFKVSRLRSFVKRHKKLVAKILAKREEDQLDYWWDMTEQSPSFVAGWLFGALQIKNERKRNGRKELNT